MKDRRMVLASYLRADRGERTVGDVLAAEIHGYLAGLDDLALTALGEDVVASDVEIVAHDFLDLVYAEVYLLLTHDLLDKVARKLYLVDAGMDS